MSSGHNNARAELFIGPMFSGKTGSILGCIDRERWSRRACVFIKHTDDTRYLEGPATRSHGSREVVKSCEATEEMGRLRVLVARNLLDVELAQDEKVVAVDEGQFFPDLPTAVDLWMREGRHIYIAALDGDYRRQVFGRVYEVIPLATKVVKLRAVCMLCTSDNPADAPYTLRVTNDTEQTLVGAKDIYKAVCPECYYANS